MRRAPFLAGLAALLILAGLAAAAFVAASGQEGWQTSYAPQKGPNYASADIAMLAGGTGLVCGSVDIDEGPAPLDPALYRTTDGGATWVSVLTLEVYGQLSGVAFSDAQHAWAVGGDYSKDSQGALLLTSSDAGKTWTRTPFTATSALEKVQFPTATAGYITGDDGAVYSTSDGGGHWTRVLAGATDVAFTGLSFADATHGWVCGGQGNEDFYGGRCYATADGGATWKDVSPDPSMVLHSLSFVSATEGWVLGEDQTVFHTSDGGATWSKERLTILSQAQLWDVHFVDAQNGWVTGSFFPSGARYDSWGVVLHTTDGGDSWVQQDSGTGELASAATATDAQHAWVAYEFGLMLRTSDAGGPGITPAGTPVTYALNAVSVRRGARATFRCRVIDPGVPRAQLKVQILDAKKHVRATIGAGWRPTEQVVVFSGKVSLKPGRYTWRAACVDYTGDVQSSASSKPLVVK
jgi:photosystem II stability/assembly factor-like uncharacterized protein